MPEGLEADVSLPLPPLLAPFEEVAGGGGGGGALLELEGGGGGGGGGVDVGRVFEVLGGLAGVVVAGGKAELGTRAVTELSAEGGS